MYIAKTRVIACSVFLKTAVWWKPHPLHKSSQYTCTLLMTTPTYYNILVGFGRFCRSTLLKGDLAILLILTPPIVFLTNSNMAVVTMKKG